MGISGDPANESEARNNLTIAIRELPSIAAVDRTMPWGNDVGLVQPNAERDYLQTAAETLVAYAGVVKTMQSTYADALAELNQFRQDQAAVRRYLGINQAPTAQ